MFKVLCIRDAWFLNPFIKGKIYEVVQVIEYDGVLFYEVQTAKGYQCLVVSSRFIPIEGYEDISEILFT